MIRVRQVDSPDSKVTKNHLKILRNALGINDPSEAEPLCYRNRYVTYPGNTVLEEMENLGLVISGRKYPWWVYYVSYSVTDKGRKLAIASFWDLKKESKK